MSIDKLVERAYQKYNAMEQAQQQGAPPAQTGRPDTSRY
jgi:hypothetical protein